MHRTAEYGLTGWHGTTWHRCVVVGETPKRYRVRLEEDARLPGRNRSGNAGDVVLMPKDAVRFGND